MTPVDTPRWHAAVHLRLRASSKQNCLVSVLCLSVWWQGQLAMKCPQHRHNKKPQKACIHFVMSDIGNYALHSVASEKTCIDLQKEINIKQDKHRYK